MMLKNIFLTGLLFFGIGIGNVFATGDQLPYVPIKKLEELAATPTADTDFIPVYDASSDSTKKLDVDRFEFVDPATGDVTHQGEVTVGVGTKHSGYITADAAEATTANDDYATITTFDVPASSTTFVEADIVGRAATNTTSIRWTASGTFERDGTSNVTLIGTDTNGSDTTYENGNTQGSPRWVLAADGVSLDLQVKAGTGATIQWITTVRSLTVTTDGTE